MQAKPTAGSRGLPTVCAHCSIGNERLTAVTVKHNIFIDCNIFGCPSSLYEEEYGMGMLAIEGMALCFCDIDRRAGSIRRPGHVVRAADQTGQCDTARLHREAERHFNRQFVPPVSAAGLSGDHLFSHESFVCQLPIWRYGDGTTYVNGNLSYQFRRENALFKRYRS